MYDTVALRSERELLRNIHVGFDDGRGLATVRQTLDLRLHDWAHAVKLSYPSHAEFAAALYANASLQRLFYDPNVTALRLRADAYMMW